LLLFNFYIFYNFSKSSWSKFDHFNIIYLNKKIKNKLKLLN